MVTPIYFFVISMYAFWPHPYMFFGSIYLCFLGISVYVYWPYLCMLFDHICVRFLRNYSRHYQPRACRYLQHRGSALPSQSAEIILSSFKPTVFNTLGKAHASPSGFPTTMKNLIEMSCKWTFLSETCVWAATVRVFWCSRDTFLTTFFFWPVLEPKLI